jgi:hypothetical protein
MSKKNPLSKFFIKRVTARIIKSALIQMSLPNKEETIQEKKKEGYQTGSLL